MIKKLKWLIQHQEEIKILVEAAQMNKDKRFSLEGVPLFQQKIINDILEDKK